jgi:ketosteroid isomerase-like protein
MPEEPTTPDLDELSRRTNEALNCRDFDAALAVWAPDGVLELSPVGFGVLAGGSVTGHAAIRRLWEELSNGFADFETTTEESHDLGSGVTLGVHVQCVRPHGSDGLVERRFGFVATSRDGLIVHGKTYVDIDEARAAAERLAEERGG